MSDDAPARRRRIPWVGLCLLAAVAGGTWWWFHRAEESTTSSPTWAVKRETLPITVTEGGSLQSLQPTVITSKVEGQARILYIVEEGRTITEEDVKNGLVLVKLDSSDLASRKNRQQIAVSTADASLTQTKSELEIQKGQNESDLRKADLDVRLAVLDLDRVLGATVAAKITAAREAGQKGAEMLRAFAADPELQGAALQSLRKLRSDIDLANEELSRAKTKLEWTQKLLEKGYVSKDELTADQLALKRTEVALDQAKTALSLFTDYEFGKSIESMLSAVLEAHAAQRLAEDRARSAMQRAEANRKAAEDRLRLENEEMAKIVDQEKATVITATNPGLVVYASSEDRGGYMGDSQPIQEGTTVRERQAIISIPDPKSIGVRINVHESALNKVKEGQRARIKVDAFPDKNFRGHVVRLSAMPSGANRWQNPDLKVYPTDVTIDDAPPQLRPGMSAKVEIAVAEVEGALTAPVQALTSHAGKPAVWVRTPTGDEARAVEVGVSNDKFVELKSGVAEGDLVLLAPPKEAPRGPSEGRQGRGRSAPGAGPGPGAPAGTTDAAMGDAPAGSGRGRRGGSGGGGGGGGNATAPGGTPAPSPTPSPGAAPAAPQPSGSGG